MLHVLHAVERRYDLRPGDGFEPRVDEVEAQISPRTKAIVINSPGNPTGYVLTAAELQSIADVCIRHDLLLISDEIYDRIWYGDRPQSPAALPGMRERTVTVNGYHLELVVAKSTDGSVAVVPAYVFTTADGAHLSPVPAVIDQYRPHGC